MKKIALALIFACTIFGGCGNPTNSPSSGNDKLPEGKLRIAVIPKGATHEFWKTIHAGANKAAQELGVEIIWQSPQLEDDRQQQIQVVQNMISQGVSAIVLAPLDAKALVPSAETAINRNIPVIVIDSALESDKQSSFIATNNKEGGKLCAKTLGEKPEPRTVSYYSDAGNFLKQWRGAPTVILGPGEPAMAHQTDEYCRMSRIRESVAIYEEIIRDWCAL